MFPDMMSQIPGSYVGVVLSSELPAADRELFEDLLKQMSDLRLQVNSPAAFPKPTMKGGNGNMSASLHLVCVLLASSPVRNKVAKI